METGAAWMRCGGQKAIIRRMSAVHVGMGYTAEYGEIMAVFPEQRRPRLALRNPDGSVWRTRAGFGWLNPYDRRVWRYDVAVATAAASEAR